jgi:hypothetical protein
MRFPFAIFLAGLVGVASAQQTATVTFEWDAVPDARVGLYELHWGDATGGYTDFITVTTPTTVGSVQQEAETTRFYAVRACTADLSLCSPFSNEVEHNVGPAPMSAPTGFGVQSTTYLP